MNIKETSQRFYFLCGKTKPLEKKMPLPQLLTICCSNWTLRTKKESDFQTLSIQRGTVLQNTLLHRKVCQICWACRLKMDDCPDNQLFLPFFTLFEVTCLYFLLTQLILFFFFGLWWSWRLNSYSCSIFCLPDAESKLW